MIRRSDVTVADSLHTPLAGVYITVLDEDGNEANIYSDDGVTSKANPFQSSVGGSFSYYADEGVYTEEYRLSLSGQPRQVVAVALGGSLSTALASRGYGKIIEAPGDNRDMSDIINDALADDDNAGVILPAGTFWIAESIVIPSGKFLKGMGRDVTWIRALPTFAKAIAHSLVSTDWTARGTIPGPGGYLWSDNVRVEDLSIHCERAGYTSPQNDALRVNGVHFERGRDCWAVNVDVYECSGYGFYHKGTAQTAGNMASGGCLNCRVDGANVGFEAHFADPVMWLNPRYTDGDELVTPEAMFHPFGASNVTIINPYGRGRGNGIYVVGISTVDIENVRVFGGDIETSGSSPINTLSASSDITGMEIHGGRYVNTAQVYGAQFSATDVKIVGAFIKGFEAGILTAASATVECVGVTSWGVALNGASAGYGFLSNNSENTFTGGLLKATGSVNVSPYAGDMQVSLTTKLDPAVPAMLPRLVALKVTDNAGASNGTTTPISVAFGNPNAWEVEVEAGRVYNITFDATWNMGTNGHTGRFGLKASGGAAGYALGWIEMSDGASTPVVSCTIITDDAGIANAGSYAELVKANISYFGRVQGAIRYRASASGLLAIEFAPSAAGAISLAGADVFQVTAL